MHDGDTLSLRCADRAFKLRLGAVDAPEYRQAQGQAARNALADHLLGRGLRVESHATDRYGRVIGEIWLDQQPVSLWLVSQGWAWCALRASETCRTVQHEARQQQRGLWQAPAPVEPWTWRAQHPR